MSTITADGASYRRFLPHFRSPGCIYHCRFSLRAPFRLADDWMFAIIEAAILAGHKKESVVYAYNVMATHAHVVVQPLPTRVDDPYGWCDYLAFHPLERVVGRMKGRSARLINQRRGVSGSLWQDESYDRTIRDMRDLDNTIDYVHNNPVRWGLVALPEQYRWSSLRTIYSGEAKYAGWFDVG